MCTIPSLTPTHVHNALSCLSQAVDSLLNFETVKYYNGEKFERDRYDNKMGDYLSWYWRSQASLNLLNVTQSVVITAGANTCSTPHPHLSPLSPSPHRLTTPSPLPFSCLFALYTAAAAPQVC